MDRLKKTGMKLTPQRMAIVKHLDGNKSHPSAEDIHKAISPKFPSMSFATVYNTLESLKDNGLIKELTIESGKKRFDPDISDHHHLICTKCRKIVDLPEDISMPQPALASAGMIKGFRILSAQINLYGICPGCSRTDS
ncbi:MAG: transcriptional repressor [Nitrospiraceae bacterium]|nr:transcriptional repressor [Nitrospiraceae bacterium]